MANKLYSETAIQDIATAIREKNGSSDTYTVSQMGAAIRGIPSGGGSGGGAELNIAYGDTAPTDTSKLWVKTTEPSGVKVSGNVEYGDETLNEIGAIDANVSDRPSVCIDKMIYFVGGSDDLQKNTINTIDTTTLIRTLLPTTLPQSICSPAVSAIGTNVYIFGGASGSSHPSSIVYNTIYCFDTETETLTTLNTVLPQAICCMSAITIGTKIYLFGGRNHYQTTYDYIWCFDSDTQTIETVGATVDKIVKPIVCAVGTKVYLFGGKTFVNGTITTTSANWCFDTETRTTKTVGTKSSKSNVPTYGCAVLIGDYIHILSMSARDKPLWKFNLTNQDFELSAVAPSFYLENNATYVEGNKAIVINSTKALEYIAPQDPMIGNGIVQIVTSLSSNLFNLINAGNMQVEIGVQSVLKGNAEGIGETVEAALHNGTSWVTI